MVEKFAFESEEVSLAFTLGDGMGDCIMAKKVFDAIIELAPNCKADIFCMKKKHEVFAKSFYCDNDNLNLILPNNGVYKDVVRKYDLALRVIGNHFTNFDYINPQRLQAMSPALFEAVVKLNQYNQQNVYNIGSVSAISSRNMMMAHILNKNWFEFLSGFGILPIRDNKIHIPLLPEYKLEFEKLKLNKYITIHSDIEEDRKNSPKAKSWSLRYLREYVARMKKRFPQVKIIQYGGGILKLTMLIVIF